MTTCRWPVLDPGRGRTEDRAAALSSCRTAPPLPPQMPIKPGPGGFRCGEKVSVEDSTFKLWLVSSFAQTSALLRSTQGDGHSWRVGFPRCDGTCSTSDRRAAPSKRGFDAVLKQCFRPKPR